jgi:hypothetical protein
MIWRLNYETPFRSTNFTFKDAIIKVDRSGISAWLSFIQDGTLIYREKPANFKNMRATSALSKQMVSG